MDYLGLTLHVACKGRKGRDFVAFRAGGLSTLDVLRLLHDSMDRVHHIPDQDESCAY